MDCIYYRVNNKEERQCGFQYRDGLNVLDKPFDENEKNWSSDGLHVVKEENIHKWLYFGIYIREVVFPKDDPEFKYVEIKKIDGIPQEYRANKLILRTKYHITNIDTIKKFKLYEHDTLLKYLLFYELQNKRTLLYTLREVLKLNMTYDVRQEIIDSDSKLIEWFKQYCKNAGFVKHLTHEAVIGNSPDTLRLLLENNIKLECNIESYAIMKGYIDVAEILYQNISNFEWKKSQCHPSSISWLKSKKLYT